MEKYECVKCGGSNIVEKLEFGLNSFYCLDCHHNFFKRSDDEQYKGKLPELGFLTDDNEECKILLKDLAKRAKQNKKCMVLIINKDKGPIIHNIQAIKNNGFWDTVMSYADNGKDVCVGVYDGPYGMNIPTINPIHAIFLSSKTFPKVFTTNMIKLLKEEY